MKIVIAGAGAVGTHLAKMLSAESHDVVLLDESEERLGKLESLFDLKAMTGSPTRIGNLKSAGTGDADQGHQRQLGNVEDHADTSLRVKRASWVGAPVVSSTSPTPRMVTV
jgi:nucleoside-diphosphate-sugar epimerase